MDPYAFIDEPFDCTSLIRSGDGTLSHPAVVRSTPAVAGTYPVFEPYPPGPPSFTLVPLHDGNPHPLRRADDKQGSERHKSISRFEPGTIRSSSVHRLLIPLYGNTVQDGMRSLKDPSWNPFRGNTYTRHGVLYEPLGMELIRQMLLWAARKNPLPGVDWTERDMSVITDHYYAHWEPCLHHVYSSPDAEVSDPVSRFYGMFRSFGMSDEDARMWMSDRMTVELKHPAVRMYPSFLDKKDHVCQTQFQADCARCDLILYAAVWVPPEQRLGPMPGGPEKVQIQLWVARRSPVFCAWLRENLVRARAFAVDPNAHHAEWQPVGKPPFYAITSRHLITRWVRVTDAMREEWIRRASSYREDSGELVDMLRDHGYTEPPAAWRAVMATANSSDANSAVADTSDTSS